MAEQVQPVESDPNKNKFIPHVIRIRKSLLKNSSKLWDLILYQQSLKPEEQFAILLEADSQFEPVTGIEAVDLAMGAGIGYLALRGFYRGERTGKVMRMAEIAEEQKRVSTTS